MTQAEELSKTGMTEKRVDADTKIAAHHLGAELDRAIFQNAYDAPVNVIRNLNVRAAYKASLFLLSKEDDSNNDNNQQQQGNN